MLAMSRQSHHANHVTMISNSRLIYSKMELALLQSSRAQSHLSVTAACIHITATWAEQNNSHTCNIMLPVSIAVCFNCVAYVCADEANLLMHELFD